MNGYYLTLVLKPNLEEKVLREFLDGVKKKMVADSGKLGKEDIWGERDLAYPIKKQTKGYFVHYEFETDPGIIKDIDKSLKIEEDVLRYLLIRR